MLTSLGISDVDTVLAWGTTVGQKTKFSAQTSKKTRDFEKNQYPKYGKNSQNT